MPIIYVENLLNKKTAICRALFEAAEKTESAKTEKNLSKQSLSSIPGVWATLQDDEIEAGIWSARHSGFLLEIGYLQVNLQFEITSIDVTYYEKTYGVSAKTILEAAGFTCSDQPISSSSYGSHSPTSTSRLYSMSSNSKSEEKAEGNHKIEPYSENIESDRRFKKSSQDGVIYEACSCGLVSDDDLIAYGAKRWERKKDGIDNIVLILEMEKNPKASQQAKMR